MSTATLHCCRREAAIPTARAARRVIRQRYRPGPPQRLQFRWCRHCRAYHIARDVRAAGPLPVRGEVRGEVPGEVREEERAQ